VSAATDSVTDMSAPVIAVPQTELDDLRDRLRRTRWPRPWPGEASIGTDADELRRLVELWAGAFDWRAQEAAINALPSHVAAIEGVDVHYLRYDAERPGALPIVITHGWPSSVRELAGLAERLSSPSRFGGSADEAFTVIVPSLPGFAFSPQRNSLLDDLPTHEIWHRLMHDELGFERYAAHGGDLGAGISARLAEAHPEAVAGIHVLAVANPRQYEPASVTAEEQLYLDAVAEWSANDGAYQHQQSTRPMTLAYGLSDSPAGLLAWLLEKYRGWSQTPLDDDFVLTQASLYWFTNTVSTSFRPYYETGRGSTVALTRVDAPTAVAVFPADLAQPPRSWAERSYNVTRYTRMPRGGHFAAREQPELLAHDITAFFADLRDRAGRKGFRAKGHLREDFFSVEPGFSSSLPGVLTQRGGHVRRSVPADREGAAVLARRRRTRELVEDERAHALQRAVVVEHEGQDDLGRRLAQQHAPHARHHHERAVGEAREVLEAVQSSRQPGQRVR